MKELKGTVLSKSGRLAPKHLRKKRGRSAVALLLCVCMALSLCEGWHLLIPTAYAATGRPTAGVTRQADPSTMDTYKVMLDFSQNTRYAGRLWSDKTVFALDDTTHSDDSNWDGTSLTLTPEDDGVNQEIELNEDFLHVYSVLGSSLELNESVTTPIDLVILLDMSGSMAAIIDGATGDRLGKSRVGQTISAINEAIGALMAMNETNRVAVVGYGATAFTLMELGHYKPNSSSDSEPYKGTYLKVDQLTNYNGGTAGTASGEYTVSADCQKKGTGDTYSSYMRSARNGYNSHGNPVRLLVITLTCRPVSTRDLTSFIEI